MTRLHTHPERHMVARVGWLRAAVLGANDGIVSTASLIVGVAAASPGQDAILISGAAGLVAGAMSMAAGEYVSVSSQSDTESADIARERLELATKGDAEHNELAQIYQQRGVLPETAALVATQLMAHDALGAHSRDELGISAMTTARPVQAAFASAATFTIGAALPLSIVIVAPAGLTVPIVAFSSIVFLALLGGLGARVGGAPALKAVLRITFWGALAMGLTAAIGRFVGVVV